MSLLDDIQEGATGTGALSPVLRKALILAARLDHEPLRQWVQWELEGYPTIEALPGYRRLGRARVLGDFSGPFGSGMKNAEIPPACIDEASRDALFEIYAASGVATYEHLLASGKGSFQEPWPGDALVRFADRIYEMQTLMAARKVIPAGALLGVLDSIRVKLLAFALEIERLDPAFSEGSQPQPAIEPDVVSQVFNVTITGGNNQVLAGDHGRQVVDLGPRWITARAELEPLLPADAIQELEESLRADRSAGTLGSVGATTESWLDRLRSGAWQVSEGTSAGVIAAIVLKFIGVE